MVKPIKIPITAIDKTKSGFTSARRRLNGLRKSLNGVSGALAGIATGVGIKAIIDTRVEFENLRASLTTVTGSAENAEAAFARIKEFAATTPFSVQQATEAFIKLKALGLDPSEDAMRAYGNTASAMGKDLNQMVEAVADAATGEFERLKEFGIKAKSQGDQVSFTFQGVTTTIGKNAAEIEEYLRGIGEVQFAGAMERQSKTIGGAISNMKDGFAQFADSLGKVVEPALAGVARWLGEYLPKAGRSFLIGFTYVSNKIVELSAIITNQIANMFKGLSALPDALGGDTFSKAEEGWRGLTREIVNYRNGMEEIGIYIVPQTTKAVNENTEAIKKNTSATNDNSNAVDKNLKKLKASANRVKVSVRTPMEELNIRLAELDQMLEEGLITWEEYGRAVEDAYEKAEKASEKSNKEVKTGTEKAYEKAGDAVERFVDRGKFSMDSLKDFALQTVLDIGKSFAKDWLGGKTGGGGFDIGSIFGGGGGGFDIGSIFGGFPSFDKGGFTGHGARSGGVDGKGGFPAILHPNEVVNDNTMSRSGGGVTIVYNINAQGANMSEDDFRRILASESPRIVETAVKASTSEVRRLAGRGGSFAKAVGRVK